MPPLVTCFSGLAGVRISPAKRTRARQIPRCLPPDLDLLVLCEAFCESSVSLLADGLKGIGLEYRTGILGSSSKCSGKLISGGVCLISRYPLIDVQELLFGPVCVRDDGLANKGVLYACFQKHQETIHVFASHTQAWDEPKCVDARKQQLCLLSDFIKRKAIPASETVLVMGDLNVPFSNQVEYQHMLETLHCADPCEHSAENPSFNHISNILASSGPSSGGSSAMLDYILISKSHKQPVSATASTHPLKTEELYQYKGQQYQDLSDHYPVIGKIEL